MTDCTTWLDARFVGIIPIIPPDARLAPESKVTPADRGKTPGCKRRTSDEWTGMRAWMTYQATAEDAALWDSWGCSVGMQSDRYPGIDIDITNAELAEAVEKLAKQILGEAPCRTGNPPKRLLMYQMAEGAGRYKWTTFKFKDRTGIEHRIEVRVSGAQYVVDGIHPKTRQPYKWDMHPTLLGPDTLTIVTAAQLDQFVAEAKKLLKESLRCELITDREQSGQQDGDGWRSTDSARPAPSVEAVRKAVACVPNTEKTERKHYIAMRYAIKGALPNDEADALEIFLDWAFLWPGNDTYDTIYGDWCRGDTPRTGWPQIQYIAEEHGFDATPWQFTPIEFDAPANDEDVPPPAEPVDLWGSFDPPPLPVDLLPPVLRDFVADQSELIGTDPAALAMGCLVACAAAISDGWKIQPKRHDPTWTESARLWAAVVGDPSTKKTPAFTKAMGPAWKIQAAWSTADEEAHECHAIEAEIHKRAMADYVKKRAKGEQPAMPVQPVKPKHRRAVVVDITTEKLAEVLSDNERGILVFHDELTGWFGAMDAYRANGGTSKDRALWLGAYNGGVTTVDRVGRGSMVVPNWSACVLGGIQPGPMKKLASRIEEDGLLQRFMVVMAHPAEAGIDRPVNLAALRAYNDMIRGLYALPPPVGVVTLSEEAAEVRDRVAAFAHQATRAGIVSPSLASHLGKWDGLFARLLLTWHVVEQAGLSAMSTWRDDDLLAPTVSTMATVVSGETAERVEAFLVNFLLPHAASFHADLLSGTPEMKHAQWIAGFSLSRRRDSITSRDVTRSYHEMKTAKRKDVQAVMEILDRLDWVWPSKCDKDGPTEWKINPLVHSRFAERAKREALRREQEREALKLIFAERR